MITHMNNITECNKLKWNESLLLRNSVRLHIWITLQNVTKWNESWLLGKKWWLSVGSCINRKKVQYQLKITKIQLNASVSYHQGKVKKVWKLRRCALLRIYVLRAQMSVRIAPPFNRVRGLELMDFWTAVMKKQEGRSNLHQSLTSDDVYP